MGVVSIISTVVYVVLFVFLIFMWARFVFDLIVSLDRAFRDRSFRPKGVLLVLAELSYTLTDPPIRAVRRVVPPLRIGNLALDFAWSIVMLALIILMSIVSSGFAF